jgi:hypothetical protein
MIAGLAILVGLLVSAWLIHVRLDVPWTAIGFVVTVVVIALALSSTSPGVGGR